MQMMYSEVCTGFIPSKDQQEENDPQNSTRSKIFQGLQNEQHSQTSQNLPRLKFESEDDKISLETISMLILELPIVNTKLFLPKPVKMIGL